MPAFSDFQHALERCMNANPPRSPDYTMSPEQDQLATVVAEMMWFKQGERQLEELTVAQRDAFSRWAYQSSQ